MKVSGCTPHLDPRVLLDRSGTSPESTLSDTFMLGGGIASSLGRIHLWTQRLTPELVDFIRPLIGRRLVISDGMATGSGSLPDAPRVRADLRVPSTARLWTAPLHQGCRRIFADLVLPFPQSQTVSPGHHQTDLSSVSRRRQFADFTGRPSFQLAYRRLWLLLRLWGGWLAPQGRQKQT